MTSRSNLGKSLKLILEAEEALAFEEDAEAGAAPEEKAEEGTVF